MLREKLHALVQDLNVASNKGLSERFDSTIGAATVLMPFGGTRQLTPALSMVAKLPVFGETTTVSGMAWGFNPYLMEADQFRGAYLCVVESVSRLVATGFDHTRLYLTFQEYFEKLRDDPARWGKPAAALLGALMAQIDLGIAAVGGKDSMSGSFENLDVPPTLVSFATGLAHVSDVVSPEFKGAGHRLVVIAPSYDALSRQSLSWLHHSRAPEPLLQLPHPATAELPRCFSRAVWAMASAFLLSRNMQPISSSRRHTVLLSSSLNPELPLMTLTALP